VLEPAIFAHMHAGAAFGIARTTYPAIIAAGLPMYGFETTARWIAIDTPAGVAAADTELRRRPLRFPA